MNGALFSERNPFGRVYDYGQHAWIQDEYNTTYINEVIIPAFERFLRSSDVKTIYLYDICCGNGVTSAKLFLTLSALAAACGRTIKYLGIDNSNHQISKANGLLETLPSTAGDSTLEFLEKNAEEFVADNACRADFIFCFFGLHLFELDLHRKIQLLKENLSKENTAFYAIYPLRVRILYRVRTPLIAEKWAEKLAGDKVRFISDDNNKYAEAITSQGSHTEFSQENPYKEKISKDVFYSFFKSWAPELRGPLNAEECEAYLTDVWAALTKLGDSVKDDEGFVDAEGENISFVDRIMRCSTVLSFTPTSTTAPTPRLTL